MRIKIPKNTPAEPDLEVYPAYGGNSYYLQSFGERGRIRRSLIDTRR